MKRHDKRLKFELITIACFLLLATGLTVFYFFGLRKISPETEEETVKTVELTITFAYQNSQWNSSMKQLISDFEAGHPEIDIVYEESYEDNVYEDSLSRKIARNELGDLVQLKTPGNYVGSGILGTIPDQVTELVTNSYSVGGNTYGVGMVDSTWGILYNRDIFEKYGLTEPNSYDQFLELCAVLKENGETPIGVGGNDLWHMEYWTNHFFRTNVISANEKWLALCSRGKTSWNSVEITRMLGDMYALFENGYVNDDWLSTSDSSLPYAMANGEMVMLCTGPWTATSVLEQNPDMNLGWFYLPDRSGVVYAAENLDTFWSITSECAEDPDKYQAAVEFLQYFYTCDDYASLCKNTCTFSLSTQPFTFNMTSIQQEVKDDFDAAPHHESVYIGDADTPEQFEKTMLTIVRDIMSGELSLEEGQQEIQDAWDSCSRQEEGL